jgi:hypothetical protein
MNTKQRILRTVIALAAVGVWGVAGAGAEQAQKGGVGQGEVSQQKSQQGLGMEGSGSSGVILGGPEIVVGRIASIQGDEIAVEGDRGQFMRLKITKDTNKVCAGGQGAKMATGQSGDKEKSEIPLSQATEQQMKSHEASKAQDQRQALNDPNRQQAEHQMGAPSKDPSTLKDVVGSTDQQANQDVARGSGFVVGGSSGCEFKAGDHVRIEASDMGTATTIKGLSGEERSKIAGRAEEPQQ